jgi:hypothetical protein
MPYFAANGDLLTTISSTGARTDRTYVATAERTQLHRFFDQDAAATAVSYAPHQIKVATADGQTTTLHQGNWTITAVETAEGRSQFVNSANNMLCVSVTFKIGKIL